MFTIAQIKEAHSKVKSGADFPNYIREIKNLGVMTYETFVSDGHTDYFGDPVYKQTSPATYSPVNISDECNMEQFKKDLKAHQKGETDYPTFIGDCAKSGVDKWVVCIEKMSCTYYDKEGKVILAEVIPG